MKTIPLHPEQEGINALILALKIKKASLQIALQKSIEEEDLWRQKLEKDSQRARENQAVLKILSFSHPLRKKVEEDLYRCFLRIARLKKRLEKISLVDRLKKEVRIQSLELQIGFYESSLNEKLPPLPENYLYKQALGWGMKSEIVLDKGARQSSNLKIYSPKRTKAPQ